MMWADKKYNKPKNMKNLFKLFGLVAVLGMASSCSNDDSGLEIPQYMSQTKSSEVSIYVNNRTRGCDVNGNMWTNKPAMISAEEVAEVLAYIATCPDACDEMPKYTRYFVQHVGGAHHQYSYRDHNGALHTGINGTAGFENLQILENSGNWQHVYNFNAGKCDNSATNNSALMTDGFNGIKAMAEYASSWSNLYKIYYYKGNYYIGLDFYAKKGDGEVPADGVYDDWVVKIVPETPVVPDDGNNDNEEEDGDDNTGDNGNTEDDGNDNTDDNEGGNDEGDNGNDDEEEYERFPTEGEIEVDIHQQEHKDWNEIKTSVHLRDTVNVRILIPIPSDYIAIPDDFDIRAGLDYNYITERVEVKYTVAGQEFETEVVLNHTKQGIEILIDGTQCKEALKVARALYGDGLTFEIHSYVYSVVQYPEIWSWLKGTEIPQTSQTQWPVSGDCCTRTRGQITSAYYESEGIHFDIKPE